MAGESPEHGAICTSLTRIISTQLLGSLCQVFSKDIKVRREPVTKLKQTAKGLYSYPDLLVVRSELEFHDEHRGVLLPRWSSSKFYTPTEAFDRGEKWPRDQTWLLELTDYLLASQSGPG